MELRCVDSRNAVTAIRGSDRLRAVMELIKQIKEAESKAKEIVEQARVDAIRRMEESRKRKSEQTAEAQNRRRKAVEQATAAAVKEGQVLVDQLKSEGRKQIESLRQQCSGSMDRGVDRVIQTIRNLQS